MLDTIVLTLNQTECAITDMARFSPSARGFYEPPYYMLGARGNFSCYQNHTKAEFEQGVYKPRLTLTQRIARTGFSITLRIEFSAPKLCFGNNFSELRDSDFERVLEILHHKLAGMGIRVSRDALRYAAISAIHYSKNIPLTDYSTCSMVMGELGKMNLTKRLDLAKTDYRNEGHAIRAHANNHEIVFYDKVKDLEQARISEKRALERDNIIQRDLFQRVNRPRQLEVLRMEVRLGNRAKIKALLAQLGIKAGMTFQELFSAAIAQKVLLHFWYESTRDMPLLALSQFKPEDIMLAMIAEGKGTTKPAKLLQRLGALMLMRSIGMRGMKALLGKHCTSRTWQRFKKELEGMNLASSMNYLAVRNVQRCLDDFEPLRMRDVAVLQVCNSHTTMD